MLLFASAFAAEVMLYAPDGPPQAGARVSLEVALADGPRPLSGAAVAVTAARGQVVGAASEVFPGRYRVSYLTPAAAAEDTLTIRADDGAPVTRSLEVRPATESAVRDAPEVEAAVTTPRIELRFPLTRPVDPAALVVRTSEGRVLETRVEPEAVVVAVEAGAERVARVMAVAVIDGALPRQRPAYGLVRLRARPQLNLTAEPGSTATIRIGRRTYGPFTADAAGALAVAFDALPGEAYFEVVVADDLGNTQKSTGPLPTPTRPVLVGLEAPVAGGRGALLWLGAWSPAGQAWTGAAPICRAGDGLRREAAWAARGLYVFAVDAPPGEGTLFDPRVDCALGEATAALRVPLGADQPDRVDLRVYPEALDADFPIAQVQAALLDRRGDRLPIDGLRLVAEEGELAVEAREGVIRGEYRGAAAVEHGFDELVASWSHPAGDGPPWTLELWAAVDGATLAVVARARDRQGRPLADVPVRLRSAPATAADPVSIEVRTDARGWVRGRMPWAGESGVVRAEAGEAGRALAVFRDAPVELPDPDVPDLVARVRLPIHAGRVRQLFIDAAPRPLLTGAGQDATIVVRMLDAGGNPVRDEPVQITADAGHVAPPEVRADGTVEARYTPPPGPVARTVHLTAQSSSTVASTDLELVPRPVRGSVSVGAGWITDFGGLSAPAVSATHAHRLPVLPEVLSTRIGVAAWSFRSEVVDPQTGDAVDVAATVVPVELGVQGVSRAGLRSVSAGIAAVVAPVHLAVDFGDARGLSGLTLASPGLALSAGAAWRLGGSELYAEARYLLFTGGGDQVTFAGSMGGLTITGGYRVLY
ncbi:MAG: hypothetical protein ACOZNI_35680 [Myxococcota bacterium]